MGKWFYPVFEGEAEVVLAALRDWDAPEYMKPMVARLCKQLEARLAEHLIPLVERSIEENKETWEKLADS